jgi:PIN domain nuclease of toxin-antitoxin system
MKDYLTDTHALLWFAAGLQKRLGPRARRAFVGLATGQSRIAVSVITLWEVALLHDEGKIQLPAGYAAWCEALAMLHGIRIEPLLHGDVEEARTVRALVDPHDRLIAGTALRLGVPLITADRRIRAEKRLRAIW